MASIRCAHCKGTHYSVSAVRDCASVVAAPAPCPFEINDMVADRDTDRVGHVTGIFPGANGWQVEVVFQDRIGDEHDRRTQSVDQWVAYDELEARRNGYAANMGAYARQHGAKHIIEEPSVEGRVQRSAPYSGPVTTAPRPDWGHVDRLRAEMARRLVRKVKGGKVGHFAVRLPSDLETVKFYRVKQVVGGRWDGKVFVDAQASSEFWPVKKAETLVEVLSAILRDVPAAEKLYGNELGKCCRCNRTLTDETSRALGIGPECRSKL